MTMADRDGVIWLDGALVPWREAKVHVLTHTLHYGLGVFEGVRAYKTERGTAVFRLQEHTDRLFRSAHILRMARMGHYDGSAIYRVEKDFVIQMGSWSAQGKGKGWVPRPVKLEAGNGLKNLKFAVALPRGDAPNSAGPDFYINMRDNLELDQKPGDPRSGFAVFGQVTEASRPVLQAINDAAVGGGYGPFGPSAPVTPIVIRRISVVGDKPAAAAPKAPAKK